MLTNKFDQPKSLEDKSLIIPMFQKKKIPLDSNAT